MDPLKIVKLEASNIKKLKAVTITPEGDVVIISGENDSGKTSTIDSIAYALGGKDLIADVPIRKGASKAKVVVDLGEFKVTRTFSALGGTQLQIEDKSGQIIGSPQTLLDKLCSKIAFDPLAFVKMESKKQLETLRKLVGLDFTALDARRKSAYDERTIANRELASAKARAAECEVDPETPDEEVSISDLMKQLSETQTFNQSNNRKRQSLRDAKDRVDKIEKEMLAKTEDIRKLEEQITAIKTDMAQLAGIREERKREVSMLTDEINQLADKSTEDIEKQINEAGTINAKVRDKKTYKKLMAEVEAAQLRSDSLTTQIENLDEEKTRLLSEAKFPLPGLSFDDTGILLNDVPFTQGSQARQLQAAVAIGIAMNPTVRVILIRDASLLDKKSMEAVAKMAADNDCQFWLEVVDSDDPAAIIIENGEVKEGE